jgi:arylsulfate sulfotransferase
MRWCLQVLLLGCLVGCGEDDSGAAHATVLPTVAETSDIRVESIEPGSTPFIQQLNLVGQRLPAVKTISYSITPRPGSVSKPVHVSYTLHALEEQGRFPTNRLLQLPVFGLYASYDNRVLLSIGFADGSTQSIPVTVVTGAYASLHAVYAAPVVLKARAPASALGFDFFLVKSNLGPPLIIDTDGAVRWVGHGVASGSSSALRGKEIIVADLNGNGFHRMQFDGSFVSTPIASQSLLRFHHNVDAGRTGFLGEFDTADDIESIIAEFDLDGSVLKEWQFARIFSDYMAGQGDDPSLFVRRSVDWFHSNAATYDPRDDSLIVSSRENFLVNVDYDTGEIRWVFGDPNKYWATFPSLRAKALTLAPGGLYPIGQHATSISRDGWLLIFNNGYQSLRQPAGAPVGDARGYSAVSAYRIDAATMTATEQWRFDYGQSISSLVCSSVYEAPDRSLLVSYAWAELGTKARVVGLNPAREVVFDLQYENNRNGCGTSWNAVPIALDDVNYP